jgi:transcriptional antiterminator
MEKSVTYHIDGSDLRAFLNEEARRLKSDELDRFRQTFVSVTWVAQLHGISKATVINYINDGLIEPEVRTVKNGKYMFRANYAINLDFPKLKIQLLNKKTTVRAKGFCPYKQINKQTK